MTRVQIGSWIAYLHGEMNAVRRDVKSPPEIARLMERRSHRGKQR